MNREREQNVLDLLDEQDDPELTLFQWVTANALHRQANATERVAISLERLEESLPRQANAPERIAHELSWIQRGRPIDLDNWASGEMPAYAIHAIPYFRDRQVAAQFAKELEGWIKKELNHHRRQDMTDAEPNICCECRDDWPCRTTRILHGEGGVMDNETDPTGLRPGEPEFGDRMIARIKELAADEGISADDWIKRWLDPEQYEDEGA